MYQNTAERLLEFIQKSPTAFQAAAEMRRRFLEQGFAELKEEERWSIEKGGSYFVSRNNSAVIAFTIPREETWKFHIIASHSDSPAFKIKENPEITVENAYVKLNIEKYGGMILSTWFDRPLSVAGRMIIRENGKLKEKLVCIEKDLLVIPSLAIHMNRGVNENSSFNVQNDLLPLYSTAGKGCSFMNRLAKETGVKEENILGRDLFLYNRTPGAVWGNDGEFISCPRLDDLQCAYASMEGFLSAEKRKSIAVCCVMDNEEVGSTTKQGAASTFLRDTLLRINMGLHRSYEEYLMTMADSFMISADNAHALHPNYTAKADPVNRPIINKGIVIKYNANQKYCTDGVSAAIFKDLCERAKVPYQTFANRSDMAGGSTLGNISNTQAALPTVDIGLPQLAMHSAYETSGVCDTQYFIEASRIFYE